MKHVLAAIWSVLPLRHLAAIVAITLIVLVGISFGRLAVATYQLHQQRDQLQARVEGLKAENSSLQRQVAFLQTDAAVEALAREELGWTKPGDVAVILVQPTVTAARSTPTGAAKVAP